MAATNYGLLCICVSSGRRRAARPINSLAAKAAAAAPHTWLVSNFIYPKDNDRPELIQLAHISLKYSPAAAAAAADDKTNCGDLHRILRLLFVF